MDVIKNDVAQASVDATESPGEIIATLLRTATFLRLRLAEFLERFELSEGRHSILIVLHHAGSHGLSQSAVAEQLMQSESNVSSLIDRLHREGLVDRHWSSTDRRKRVLMLTADGQRLIHQVELARCRWAESLLSGVSVHDRHVMADAIQHLPAGNVDHRPTSQAAISSAEAMHVTAGWLPVPAEPGRELNSPHFALERMLSKLGMAGHLAGDDE
ncbi:MAG: winged helix DNA-binding protein [Planctomycetes bacterium]|nr:winged helix DNA-binding protein [Planctomycetota bacterium]